MLKFRGANNIPAIVRIYNDFESRYSKQRQANELVNKEARENPIPKGKAYTPPKRLQKFVASLDKIKLLDNHEFVGSREQAISSIELCGYFETYIRFARNCLIRNFIHNKRSNLGRIFQTIVNL